MRRKPWSIRALMILTAVIGVDVALVIQSTRLGPGIEFTLFIAAVASVWPAQRAARLHPVRALRFE